MNILLVDDDRYVLEVLQKSMDWGSIGIANVYTAQSVHNAQRIIEDIPIQLLVCDIEMPKENGLELLKWIKHKRYIIQTILLTSYAEFRYATEAIKYGCFAYALKPIKYEELQEMIIGAKKAEEKALSLIDYEKYDRFWTTSEKIRKERYFYDMLITNQDVDPLEYGIEYKNNRFIPMIIRYYAKDEDFTYEFGNGMFEWTIKNQIYELFTTKAYSAEAVLLQQNDEVLVLLQLLVDKEDRSAIERLATTFLTKVKRKVQLDCGVILGCLTKLANLKEDISLFNIYLKNALVDFDKVVHLKNYRISKAIYQAPDFILWEKFLKNQKDEALKKEIDSYFNRQSVSNRMDKDTLYHLVTSFIQLLVTVLKEKGITMYKIDTSFYDNELIRYSTFNISTAKKGMHRMIDEVMNMISEEKDVTSIVDIVKEYIDSHLDEELTREILAERVHLNQDYLSRIFKKEVGESLGNYITKKRMDMAKEYLQKTKETVNAVALQVGYDNFSYFTKVFKSTYGMTPKEFRKEKQIKE